MKRLLGLVFIFLLGLLFLRGWWNYQISPVSKAQTEVTIIIPKGAGVGDIADKLKKENLIRSTLVFKILVKQKGLDTNLSAGTFKLAPNLSTDQIIDKLSGNPTETWITLLEGWRVEEMAEEINSKLQIPKDKFLAVAKEGYMFPDTYLIPHDYSAKNIADLLENTFSIKYSDELKSKIKKKGLTEGEGVILASIVEREARSSEARKMVASILLKRLNIGMGLNVDSTIQYARGYQPGEKSWWKKSLTKDDLKIDSPYNTYIHRGLPPTPICNPSLSSLEAVANADAVTPYLYYYHDSKGVSHYAKTLDEHNQNVANFP